MSGSWTFNWVLITPVIAASILFWAATQSPDSGNKRPWNYSTNYKIENKSKECIKSPGRSCGSKG